MARNHVSCFSSREMQVSTLSFPSWARQRNRNLATICAGCGFGSPSCWWPFLPGKSIFLFASQICMTAVVLSGSCSSHPKSTLFGATKFLKPPLSCHQMFASHFLQLLLLPKRTLWGAFLLKLLDACKSLPFQTYANNRHSLEDGQALLEKHALEEGAAPEKNSHGLVGRSQACKKAPNNFVLGRSSFHKKRFSGVLRGTSSCCAFLPKNTQLRGDPLFRSALPKQSFWEPVLHACNILPQGNHACCFLKLLFPSTNHSCLEPLKAQFWEPLFHSTESASHF